MDAPDPGPPQPAPGLPAVDLAAVDPAELAKLAEKIHDWLTVNGLGHFLVAASYIPALKVASLSVAESPDHFAARAVASAVQQGRRS